MPSSTLRRPYLIIAGIALALAGCTKKPPKSLPPAPLDGAATAPGTSVGASDASSAGDMTPGSPGDFVRSVVADRIFFDTDSSDVDATDRATLQSQAAWLARYPARLVTIEGHADERGTREYNLALGERRANATKNALAALGVAAARMTTISLGKERPAATGSDEAAWALNRRAVTVTAR